MCTAAQWILKRGITAQVPILTNPGPYTGNINSLHAAYKQKLKLYEEYEEHKQNTNKAIQACFDVDLFVKQTRNRQIVTQNHSNRRLQTHVDELSTKGGQGTRNSKKKNSSRWTTTWIELSNTTTKTLTRQDNY